MPIDASTGRQFRGFNEAGAIKWTIAYYRETRALDRPLKGVFQPTTEGRRFIDLTYVLPTGGALIVEVKAGQGRLYRTQAVKDGLILGTPLDNVPRNPVVTESAWHLYPGEQGRKPSADTIQRALLVADVYLHVGPGPRDGSTQETNVDGLSATERRLVRAGDLSTGRSVIPFASPVNASMPGVAGSGVEGILSSTSNVIQFPGNQPVVPTSGGPLLRKVA